MKVIIKYRESMKAGTKAETIEINNVKRIGRLKSSNIRVIYEKDGAYITAQYGVGSNDCCMGYEVHRTEEEHNSKQSEEDK